MSQRPSVRAGLIGFGIGKFYAAALHSLPVYYPELPTVELTAVATATAASGEQARRQFNVPTNERFPDAALPGYDLPLGMMRLHIAGLADFLQRTIERRPYDPNLAQGLRVQAVIEAAAESARS